MVANLNSEWLELFATSKPNKPQKLQKNGYFWFQGVNCGQVFSNEPHEQPASSPLSLNCSDTVLSKIWINVVHN